MSGLSVLQPGVQSGLQDLGRFGFAGQGISQGGAMDLHAHCWVNKLLGNDVCCATLEMAVGMAKFRAECDLQLAIAGADMVAQVDGEVVGNWCSFFISRGQVLSFKAAGQGMRAYLGVAGGFKANASMGSVSTVVRNQLGRFVEEGDVLSATEARLDVSRQVPARFIPEYRDVITLRVIESYQVYQFARDQIEAFYAADFAVTKDADRMGVRLEGEPVASLAEGMISEGIALGAIQVPPDGQPIILMNDRQTLGGYPKLGCVARIDLAKLAQARPGDKVRFEPVTLGEARNEWREFMEFFNMPGGC